MSVDYEALIKNGLAAREKNPDLCRSHSEHRSPIYVVNMCEKVLAAIHQQGAAHVTLDDVLMQDRCASGHADYLRKFALYCRELEASSPKPSQAMRR